MINLSQVRDISQYFCFPLDKFDIKFGGSFFFSDSYVFGVVISKCNSNLPGNTCETDQIITEKLQYGYVNVYYPIFSVDPTLADPIL